MFVLGRPEAHALERVLAIQRLAAVTYDEVGATRGGMPGGYRHDRHQMVVGQGDETFQRAGEALRRWAVHRGAGLTVCPEVPDLREGVTIVLALALPVVTMVASCRIVYVVDVPGAFGFAYGTLPAHPERGEEAFVVRQGPDGAVTFTITAFSRPRHPLARLGGPLTRRIQVQTTRRYLDALRAFAA